MVSLRPAKLADGPALFELVRAFPTPTPCSADQYSRAFDAKLTDTNSCVLVAEQGGRLVGYLAGYRHHTFYASGPAAWVDEVLVLEPFRGSGIGRELMRAFESRAKASGCVLVSLATRGAAGFYERLGYESRAQYYKKYLA